MEFRSGTLVVVPSGRPRGGGLVLAAVGRRSLCECLDCSLCFLMRTMLWASLFCFGCGWSFWAREVEASRTPGVRRSTRQRVAPLKWWKGDKFQYGVDEEGLPVAEGIIKGPSATPSPTR